MKKAITKAFAMILSAAVIMLTLAGCATTKPSSGSASDSTVVEKKSRPVRIDEHTHRFVETIGEMKYELYMLNLEAYDENNELLWDYSSAPCNGYDGLDYEMLEYVGIFGDLVLVNEQYICRALKTEEENKTVGTDFHLRVLDVFTGAVIANNEFVDGFGAYKYDEENEILYFVGINGSTLYALGKDGKYLWTCDPEVDAYWGSDIRLELDRIVVHFDECALENYGDTPVDLAYSYDGKFIGIE